MYTYVFNTFLYDRHTGTCTYVSMCMYMHFSVCAYIYIYIYIYIIHTDIHTYIQYIHTCTASAYIHSYIHIHTYMQTPDGQIAVQMLHAQRLGLISPMHLQMALSNRGTCMYVC